jgi:hypothetical protein
LQQAVLAQTLIVMPPVTAGGVATIAALQLEQDNLYDAYRKLRQQDVANQAVVLDNAIGAAQTAIIALNATVQGMTLPVPPPDNVDALVNIQTVVTNSVRQIANVVADE